MAALTPDAIILGLLAAQARHGYQLLDCFHDSHQLGRVWNLSTSQVYNVLKRLERQSLIVGHEIPSANSPPRTVYALTEAGQQRLMAWLYDPAPSASIRRVRVEFLSRLFTARELNRPTAEIVRRQQQACQRERERLLIERQAASPGMETLTIDFVIEQLDAVLRWIARCELVPPDAGDIQDEWNASS